MGKLRSLSTSIWSDPFIEELKPSEKLLFIYLITNDKTNMLGIYEVSIRKITFDTGLKKEEVVKALKEFERLKKVKYVNNFVILVNFLKHQNFNTNMKKSAIDVYNDLPNELKDSKLTIHKGNPSEGFESLCKHYGMVRKVEVEVEVEVEEEKKDDKKKHTKDAKAKFLKLPQKDVDKILLTVKSYVSSVENKQYLPLPTTYLNKELYNDEIIVLKKVSYSGKQTLSF